MCRTTPPAMAGTIGAIFNGALQLGSALGISIVGSIEVSVEATHGGPTSYAGRAAAFWFLTGLVGVEAIALLVFYRIDKEGSAQPEALEGKEKSGSAGEVEEIVGEKGLKVVVEDELEVGLGRPDESMEEGGVHTRVTEVPVSKGDHNV